MLDKIRVALGRLRMELAAAKTVGEIRLVHNRAEAFVADATAAADATMLVRAAGIAYDAERKLGKLAGAGDDDLGPNVERIRRRGLLNDDEAARDREKIVAARRRRIGAAGATSEAASMVLVPPSSVDGEARFYRGHDGIQTRYLVGVSKHAIAGTDCSGYDRSALGRRNDPRARRRPGAPGRGDLMPNLTADPVAMHEAAHIVAAFAVGAHIVRASAKQGDAGVRTRIWLGRTPRDRIAGLERSIIIDLAATCLDRDREACATDEQNAMEKALRICRLRYGLDGEDDEYRADAARLLMHLRVEARGLVAQHRPVVALVARALAGGKELGHDDVEKLIASDQAPARRKRDLKT